ncbi:YHS domain-containing protein [candidate division KSB1 bacterium]|nr:YHS domain-containing protein [candidate division KSB1 bacterium]
MKTKAFSFIGILVLLLGSATGGFTDEKLIIKGYDPVAYFIAGKPVKGRKDFAHQWMGATFRFSSKENLELFKKAPEKYAPQYGGYCSYAVSQGYTAPVDPEAWAIVNGKLYLNYSKSVQKKWREKRDEYIAAADKNWPELKAKEQKSHKG